MKTTQQKEEDNLSSWQHWQYGIKHHALHTIKFTLLLSLRFTYTGLGNRCCFCFWLLRYSIFIIIFFFFALTLFSFPYRPNATLLGSVYRITITTIIQTVQKTITQEDKVLGQLGWFVGLLRLLLKKTKSSTKVSFKPTNDKQCMMKI